ncbi:ADP-ribosyltransferase [Gordonia sp. 135]|uniref:ADP-ribosyltransferase n=1 Tax=Gordonia sp. 135 TaxID=2676309 RepID=UPI0018AD1247|nr:ADP-ribosyltransferase [Gordonia sp. 135]
MRFHRDDVIQKTRFEVVKSPLEILTEHERSVLQSYAISGHNRINAALRGDIEMTPEIEHLVATIRSALRRIPLKASVRVTRSVDAQALAGVEPGRQVRFPGFLSTSMAPEPPTASPLDHQVMDLLVIAGTPAVALGELAEFPLEKELLIIDNPLVHFTAVDFEAVPPCARGFVVPEEEHL